MPHILPLTAQRDGCRARGSFAWRLCSVNWISSAKQRPIAFFGMRPPVNPPLMLTLLHVPMHHSYAVRRT